MVTDPAAAKEFYSSLFGWEIQEGPPEAGGYALCLVDGRAAAAITPTPEGNPAPSAWSTYLASDDLDATVAKAKEAGSQFPMEPMDVMTQGRLAVGTDPTGALYGIWQAADHKGVGVYNEPGSLTWNELMTHDYEGAKAFYGNVFGYEYDEIGDGGTFLYSTVKRAGDGEVVAGIGALGAEVPSEMAPHWLTYFHVADADATAAKAAELGATVQREPSDTPFGRIAVIKGPQDEIFSILQPPQREGSAGSDTDAASEESTDTQTEAASDA